MSDRSPRRSRILWVGALCLLLTGLAAASVAAQARQSPLGARRPLLARAIRARILGARLTADQRQQIRGILQAHQADLKALREKAKALRQARQSGGQVNPQELQDLKARRQAIMKAVRGEVFKVLTPEQQQRLKRKRGRE